MKIIITTPLLQFLLIFVVRSAKDVQVDATVGLYGPDRYEGLPEICLKPMDFGYCRAKVQRYYFDIRRMKCNMFFWGGCAGNENNFKSMEECNQFCAAAYDDSNNSVVPPKRERADITAANNDNYNSNVNTKYSALNSRGSSITKAAPKFTVKPNPNSRETVTNGSVKASAKSFNVNVAPKTYQPSTTENIEDEEYDD